MDTISTAIRAAETGHLVLSTLHTADAAQTVDRIIDVFPLGQQQQIRLQVSQVIEAVLSQALLPNLVKAGLVSAENALMKSSNQPQLKGKLGFEFDAISRMKCGPIR